MRYAKANGVPAADCRIRFFKSGYEVAVPGDKQIKKKACCTIVAGGLSFAPTPSLFEPPSADPMKEG